MGRARRKFRPHPGPLPQERVKEVARSDRAAPTARLLRGTFPLSQPAFDDHRCSDGRERKHQKGDGLWAAAVTPSPGGEGRGEGGIPSVGVLTERWGLARTLALPVLWTVYVGRGVEREGVIKCITVRHLIFGGSKATKG